MNTAVKNILAGFLGVLAVAVGSLALCGLGHIVLTYIFHYQFFVLSLECLGAGVITAVIIAFVVLISLIIKEELLDKYF